jgi:hypothetical protein
MRREDPDYILSPAELTGLTAAFCPRIGRLGVVGPAEPAGGKQTRAMQSLAQLPQTDQIVLRRILTTLAAPGKVVELHTTTADERLTRQILALPAAPTGDLALLTTNGDHWRVGTQSPFAVKTVIRDILAANDGPAPEMLSIPLPTQAVVTLLAIIDHQRYARQYSELVHEAPIDSFTPREVLARFEDAETDDFRWPLLFIEKLIPAGVLASYSDASVATGLRALTKAGLVEPLTNDIVREVRSDQLYQLTTAGEVIADTVLHDVSKVAFSVSECLPDGVGQDVVLFVRGGLRLMLFLLSGTNGAVAALDADALNTLLDAWFEPPSAEAIAASQKPLPATTAPPIARQPTDGVPAAESQAGVSRRPESDPGAAPIFAVVSSEPQWPSPAGTRTCATCGTPLAPTAKFCIQCGHPVAAHGAMAPVAVSQSDASQSQRGAGQAGGVAPHTQSWTPAPQAAPGTHQAPSQEDKKPSLGCYLGAAAAAIVLAVLMIGIGVGLAALLRANGIGATTPPPTATVVAAVTAVPEPAQPVQEGNPTDPPPTLTQEAPDGESAQDDNADAMEETAPTPTEEPTAQATPTKEPDTPAPTAAPSLTGDQYLDESTMWDDFSSKAFGWSEKTDGDGGRTYVDDAYVIYDRVGIYIVSDVPVDFTPTSIDFEAALDVGLQDGEYGVICHYQDDANWDAVGIHPAEGTYHVAQLVDNEYIGMTSPLWQTAPNLDTTLGAVNQIGVECLDEEIGLSINGEFVGRWTLQIPREPRGMALYVYGYSDDIEPYSVIFDNVRTWVPVP